MSSPCDIEEYKLWYHEPYLEKLGAPFLLALISTTREDKDIWNFMDFDNSREKLLSGNFAITKGMVMDTFGVLCTQNLQQLRHNIAGHHGPIKDRDIHDVMCSNYCVINDQLRIEAMNRSKCDCLALSLSQGDYHYEEEGSFCKRNSGDYLCSKLGQCGTWQCEVSDFGCKRNEYNLKEVPLRGYGDDCSSAPSANQFLLVIALFSWIGSILVL